MVKKENQKLAAYLPETFYFNKDRLMKRDKDFRMDGFETAVEVTARKVGEWCNYYAAELLSPIKEARITKKEGELPKNKKERDNFIKQLTKWIFENSETDELFALFLSDGPVFAHNARGKSPSCPKFCHHDDTCCWDLSLTEKEFKDLQKEWKSNGLSADLFYESSRTICIPNKPGSLGKFFRIFGLNFESKRCYSPREWEIFNRSKTGQ